MVTNNIVLENARIGFRNFEGREGRFNAAGSRNFCVFLNPDQARALEEEGWAIRWTHPSDPDEDPQGFLSVSVKYGYISPKVALIKNGGLPTELGENEIAMLDKAEIDYVDLVIRPYNWEVNGHSGVKAYLKSMYVKLVEDPLAAKYYSQEPVPAGAEDMPW